MLIPILLLPPAGRLVVSALLVVSRGTLLLMALYHVPLLAPALYNAFEYAPLSPLQAQRILAALFIVPEVAAWLLRRIYAASALIEDGALVVEQRRQRRTLPLAKLGTVVPWAVPLPRAGFDLRARSGERMLEGMAAVDPTVLLAALSTGGAAAQVEQALRHPVVRYAYARQRVRGFLDHPLFKFVAYSLVPAIPLFRLRQVITYGGSFGEYHEYGLKAYLLGFGIYWLMSAMYLLLFASILRAFCEAIAFVAAWSARGWDLGVRRIVEFVHRAVYYLAPPALMILRLVLQ